MLIDAVTPKELSIYMIGAAIAPATAISAVLYWLRVPTIDFAVVFATLWMISAMVIDLLTPEPPSPLVAIIALAPMVVVGIAINFLHWFRPLSVPTTDI